MVSFAFIYLMLGNQVLKYLNVKGNSYDSGSNESLAKMLKHNKALTALNLSSCKLGGKSSMSVYTCNHKCLSALCKKKRTSKESPVLIQVRLIINDDYVKESELN